MSDFERFMVELLLGVGMIMALGMLYRIAETLESIRRSLVQGEPDD
jgi:hypothetical protein